MKRLFALSFFFLILNACVTHAPDRQIASVSVAPFEVTNKGYKLNGQINDVPGSDTVVVFYHGSGILDRWATMPASMTLDGKPSPLFKILSEEFNKNGISTCVFDKRVFREKNTPAFDETLKTFTFENIKSDANAVLNYVEGINKYNKVILVGHSEGTITASEIAFNRPEDKKIVAIVLMGVVGENLKESLKHQLTDVMAQNTFAAADVNRDGKVYAAEVPESLKAGLPIDKIDTKKKGYITYDDLMKVLTAQSNQFMSAVEKAPGDVILMGKPVQWYRDLFNRKTLVERANEYAHPVLIAHGQMDTNVFYKTNAVPLEQAMKAQGKDVTLISFPTYGHGFSPLKDGQPTLGPIQQDAVDAIAGWVSKVSK